MTEQLPISINVCNDFTEQWNQINSITNKLAAQFNFQAMTANWYGDEDTILYIQLQLETPQSFVIEKEKQQIKSFKAFTVHSDDVFSFIDNNEPPQLICTIAITEFEQDLLNKQVKVLASFLQIKLQKVLNIIAKQLNLQTI
mgnify:CR=1 FL=1